MRKYRIYPSGKQKVKLFNSFRICKETYNELLGLNKKLWTSNKYDFNSLVLDLKICNPELKNVHSQVLQNVSDRLSKAFDNFFRRIKDKKQGKKAKAGFPRFKNKVNSIIYPQSGFKFASNTRIFASKIGNIPIVLHRIPKGKIKTMAIKVNPTGHWFAVFACEIEAPQIKHASAEKIGLDVGIERFLTDNKGNLVKNNRFYIQSEKKLARLQRRLSRKIKGSNNRQKARLKVARQHLKVANQRIDFLHKLSHNLTKSYAFIAIEELNIKNMAKNHNLAKHISDASLGTFYNMLSYKAVTCGGQVVKNPKTRGSSMRCNNCGCEVEMPLRKRKFICPDCGLVLHRDHNAALNHLKDTVGLTGINTPVEILPLPSSYGKASKVIEAGTTYGT
jgi:putative transposase